MTRVEAGGVAFEVDAIAFDKDGTLIDLDAAWGPAAKHWVETAAAGDAGLEQELTAELGLHHGTERLVNGGLFAVGTVAQLYETTLASALPTWDRRVAGACHRLDSEKSLGGSGREGEPRGVG